MNKSTTAEIGREWANEPLSDGDKTALVELALEDLTGELLGQPDVKALVKELGEKALGEAARKAEGETIDRMNGHWSSTKV